MTFRQRRMVEILIRIGPQAPLSSAQAKGVAFKSSRWNTVQGEENMSLQRRDLLLVVTLAAAAATPVFGQAVAPTVGSADSGGQSAAYIPDFSGIWVHGSIPGFEPLASGPTSLVNRSRRNEVIESKPYT